MRTLGLDIGGANLKAADGFDAARSAPFPLWRNPAGLTDALRSLAGNFPPFDRLAVTMTGELCDCFETKAEGVSHILDACEALAAGRPVWVWQTAGEFVDRRTAREFWQLTAAANWHASATFVGRCAPEGNALFVDMGSTTTDLIPLENGVPVPEGRTDVERMHAKELLYRGASRTPLCTAWVLDTGDAPNVSVWLAAELFATAGDAYVVAGVLPEDPANTDTADGRPRTRDRCLDRIARQACADRSELTDTELNGMARSYIQQVERLLQNCAEGVSRRDGGPETLLIAGSGAAVLRSWIETPVWKSCGITPREVIDLTKLLSPAVSAALPAHAVARLCDERC